MDKGQKKMIAAGILAVAVTAGVCIGTVAFVSSRADVRVTALAAESKKMDNKKDTKEALDETTAGLEKKETEISTETRADVEQSDAAAGKGFANTETASTVDLGDIIVDKDPVLYSYEDMEHDMKLWEQAFPQLITVNSLGKTFDGREIYDMVIGDINAPNHVMINASIHAREYITTQLVMKQAAAFLQNPAESRQYLENTVIHVIPMINPDGVAISQFGLDKLNKQETKDMVQVISQLDGASDMNSYLRRWKANAQGVDVNRNFDALWEDYGGPSQVSSDRYKGEAVGCIPESAALIQLTNSYNFVKTVSYHTQGGVIYWYFGQTGQLRDRTEGMAQAVSAVTGYPLDANYQNLDPAGYKDWAISKKGIPSLTIEVGRDTSPVDPAQFQEIWNKNKEVWRVILNY
ncbi:peptidase [Clostridium sp. MCC353]|uniref:M14 family zinc carboxypeptidase n=1 Tax=Clostridium sp. MCC353 TaxID=2592646 RepID=UPI001C02B6B0|nr:M14 family zinc carboxypeptidase [Clostridium sp. MCC353]MBT9778497.1 peptidase [Clostridium sp. MCC353]